MTIDAAYAAPLADPMFAMLENSLAPYLDGDLDASGHLADALLEILAAAEPTPALLATLYQAIKTLPPTAELMGPLHTAIGAALELDTPALAATATRPAARPTPAASRSESIGAKIRAIFADNPGVRYRVGDLVKALGGAHSGGAISAALNAMTTRGEAVQVAEGPKLYLAADDPAAPASAPEQAPAARTTAKKA